MQIITKAERQHLRRDSGLRVTKLPGQRVTGSPEQEVTGSDRIPIPQACFWCLVVIAMCKLLQDTRIFKANRRRRRTKSTEGNFVLKSKQKQQRD